MLSQWVFFLSFCYHFCHWHFTDPYLDFCKAVFWQGKTARIKFNWNIIANNSTHFQATIGQKRLSRHDIHLKVCGPFLTAKDTSSICEVDVPVFAHLSLLVQREPNKSVIITAIDLRQLGSIYPSRQSPAASRPSQPGSFPALSHIWSLDVCVHVYFGLFRALDQTPVSYDHAPFAAFVLELSLVQMGKIESSSSGLHTGCWSDKCAFDLSHEFCKVK